MLILILALLFGLVALFLLLRSMRNFSAQIHGTFGSKIRGIIKLILLIELIIYILVFLVVMVKTVFL